MEAVFTVGQSKRQESVRRCLTPDTKEATIGQGAIDDTSFTGFAFTRTEGEDIYNITSYRTVKGGVCYAIEETIHSRKLETYPVEYELLPLDEAEVKGVVERIIKTFRFFKSLRIGLIITN